MVVSEFHDEFAVTRVESVRTDNEAASRFAPKCRNRTFDFPDIVNGSCNRLHPERTGSNLVERSHKIRSAPRRRHGIEHDRDPLHPWDGPLQQLQPLAADLRIESAEARDI